MYCFVKDTTSRLLRTMREMQRVNCVFDFKLGPMFIPRGSTRGQLHQIKGLLNKHTSNVHINMMCYMRKQFL